MAETTQVDNTKDLFVKMALSAWEMYNSRATKLIDSLSDEQLLSETAPGRNRGIYLVGHLAIVSDAMYTLMGWGERNYPHLDVTFIKSPDKSSEDLPVKEVREIWRNVLEKVTERINAMKVDEWFAKHTAVSDADFVKEPHRNKLNLLMNRTSHMSYHLGQLVYLVKK
ncbi:MAG: DinB family protein [Bacteroidia bacterium]|nr:DinB family protein [Bacteroidia bacterium]